MGLRGPVQARQPLPSRGHTAGSVVLLFTVPMFPVAPVYPLHGPVTASRPGPYRSGRCASNPGAPVFVPVGTLAAADAPAGATLAAADATAGGPLTAADAPLGGPRTAADAPGVTLTASDTRTGGPG